jgi:heme A synthase
VELEGKSTPIAKAVGLGRLSLLLLFSTLGIAGCWHVLYGVSLIQAVAVVGEIAVLVAVAFVCAWRWSK